MANPMIELDVDLKSKGGFRYRKCGDIVSFSFLGSSIYLQVGDVACVSMFGLNLFKRVGDSSCLFGVNWNG